MGESFPRYRPSGNPGLLTLPLFALGAGAAVLVAFPYQLLFKHFAFIPIGLAYPALLGLLLGAGASLVVRQGPCRNRAVAGFLALLVAIIAVAASHYWNYRWALCDAGVDGSLTIPIDDYLRLRTRSCWRLQKSGIDVTGIAVVVVWLLELLIVAGVTGAMA